MEVRKYDAARGGGFCITSKKIVAVALTAAMCLGLSMTAFASKDTVWSNNDLWSPTELKKQGPSDTAGNAFAPIYDAEGNVIPGIWSNPYIVARDSKGNAVRTQWKELSKKTLESIDKESKVADIFKKNGYDVPDDVDFIPLFNGNITFTDGVPTGGGQVTFGMANLGIDSSSYEPGDTVYVMQETSPGSGVWEVYSGVVGQAMDVTVTLPRNGSIVLVKTLSDGSVITLDRSTGEVVDRKPADNVANNNAGKGTSTNASGATSPKTGEF